MVVQHNMQAMNSNRMLGVTTSAQGKSTEKLSSGYRINRAADDAAGLAISEKMRKQINGLDRASTNAQDGVSSVQTAEGAMNEVHSMIQRMNELAVQAANGTNSDSDRQAIQNEITQLTTEIDRVAETTKFNETFLLKGDPSAAKKNISLKGHDAGLAGKMVQDTDTATGEKINGQYVLEVDELHTNDVVNIGGLQYTIVSAHSGTSPYTGDFENKKVTADEAYQLMQIELFKANMVGIAELTPAAQAGLVEPVKSATDITNNLGVFQGTYTSGTGTASLANNYTRFDNQTVSGAAAGGNPVANTVANVVQDTGNHRKFTITTGSVETAKELSFNLHVGADAALSNKIVVDIETFNSTYLGINKLDVVGPDGDNGITATYAIDAIADALQKVSDQRSMLGAIQNRLEHSIANLDNVVENTTAAESRIRDTDMAEEMVQYSKNNILAQAGQSMLAQANQSTQGVMSLLQ
ncbi:flagellin [Lachnospiraceae bacterium XBD2001]|nr:flagellin [Lachnospiraceae bacterium XBD2001]